MSAELQVDHFTGKTCYFLLRNSVGLIWNGSAFEAYVSGHYSTYPISGTEQGTSGFYTGNMPAASEDVYNVLAKVQSGGSPAETDTTIGSQDSLFWTGTIVAITVHALVTAALSSIASTLFTRNMSNDEGSAAAQSLCGAVLKLTSAFALSELANTATTYKTNGTSIFMTQSLTKDSSLVPVKSLGVGA